MRDQLVKGLDALGIAYEENQVDLCLAYAQLLIKWNKSFNLTAIKQPNKIVSYLLLDSLSVLPHLKAPSSVMDVGTGAGLPGVPLAIFTPQTQWVLCDSNGKKTRFVLQVCAELGLKNISVENKRVEDYHREQPFDVIISKAYASLFDFLTSATHLCDEKTCFMTLKSGLPKKEKKAVNKQNYQLDECFLTVPGISEPRSIVTIKKQNMPNTHD